MDIVIIKDKYKYRYCICPHCDSELKIRKNTINYSYCAGYNIATINCPCCNRDFALHR